MIEKKMMLNLDLRSTTHCACKSLKSVHLMTAIWIVCLFMIIWDNPTHMYCHVTNVLNMGRPGLGCRRDREKTTCDTMSINWMKGGWSWTPPSRCWPVALHENSFPENCSRNPHRSGCTKSRGHTNVRSTWHHRCCLRKTSEQKRRKKKTYFFQTWNTFFFTTKVVLQLTS